MLAQQASQKHEVNLPQESSESSSNVPSLVSSSSSTPQTEAVDMSLKSASNLPPLSEVEASSQASRLQLGMLGVGGYGTTSAELGWTGDWPDYSTIPPPTDRISDIPAKSSCCGGGAPPPDPKPVAAVGSCCAGKTSRPAVEQGSGVEQFTTTMQNGQSQIPMHLDLSFSNRFPLSGPAFSAQASNGAMFAEDQFGCLHEPDHACQCGEGCECLGCSMHPANRTTTDYVRYHTELAMRGWVDPAHFQMPPPPRYEQPFEGFSTGHALRNFHGVNGALVSQHNPYMAASPQLVQPHFMPQWQGSQHHIATPTFEMSQFTIQQLTPLTTPPVQIEQPRPQSSPQAGTEHEETHSRSHVHQLSVNETNTYDHESPSTEDDASTLSPSAFSVQQYNIPGCNDVTGSCLCGDGCQCDGCLTHNGHGNRVAKRSGAEGLNNGSRTTQETMGSTFAHSAFGDILQGSVFPSAGTG